MSFVDFSTFHLSSQKWIPIIETAKLDGESATLKIR